MLNSKLEHCLSAWGGCNDDPLAGLWGVRVGNSTLLPHSCLYFHVCLSAHQHLSIHSAMDAFAQTLMKDAVNCDKHSDLQNSVNQLDFEYGLCCRGSPCKHTFSMYLALCTQSVFVLCAGSISWAL